MRTYDVKVETRQRQPDGNYFRAYRVLATTSGEAVAKVKSRIGKRGRAYLVR